MKIKNYVAKDATELNTYLYHFFGEFSDVCDIEFEYKDDKKYIIVHYEDMGKLKFFLVENF